MQHDMRSASYINAKHYSVIASSSIKEAFTEGQEWSNSRTKLFGSKVLPLLLVLLGITSLVAQGENTPCTSTFFSALVQLLPCRTAIAPFSPIPPTEACCNAVKALGQPCLCFLVNGPPISGVDRNMALQLPEKCTANFEPSLSLSLSLTHTHKFK